MDITVENIATVEIPADLEAAILGKLETKTPDYLTGKGYVVKQKTDYDTEITTLTHNAVRKALGDESATLYGSIDSLLQIALGETKPEKMRTRDFVEKLETEGKLPLSADALEKLRNSLKGNSATKDAVIQALEKKIEDQGKADEERTKESFAKAAKLAVKNDLSTAPVFVAVDAKDEVKFKAAQKAARADLESFFNTLYEPKADSDTGEMYFVKKGTDVALMNVAEGRPMTSTEIFRANHPMYLTAASHQQTGGGTIKVPGNEQTGFSSLAEIRKFAIETKGFPAYTDEFNKFVAEQRKIAKL